MRKDPAWAEAGGLGGLGFPQGHQRHVLYVPHSFPVHAASPPCPTWECSLPGKYA